MLSAIQVPTRTIELLSAGCMLCAVMVLSVPGQYTRLYFPSFFSLPTSPQKLVSINNLNFCVVLFSGAGLRFLLIW